MTPSPVKRYRQKSRLLGGERGANLREQALELAQKGLANRRGGPVDQGSPQAQKQAADRLQSERAQALAEQQRDKQLAGAKPQTDQVQSFSRFQLHRNATGNKRAGQMFRTVADPKRGGVIHDYGGGKRVFVRKDASARETGPTAGTYNRGLKPSGGSAQQGALEQLARQRATQDRPKAKRKLFARA